MKKFFILTLIIYLFSFLGMNIAQASSIYYGTASATLRAQIKTGGNPPTAPQLQNPNNNDHICIDNPTFSWLESTDDSGVSNYNFSLSGELSDGSNFNFGKNFAGPTTQTDFKVWFENGKYFLQLTDSLNWGTYKWNVTANDANGNHTVSDTYTLYHLEVDCTYDCQNLSLLSQVQLAAPQGIIDNRNPAIVLNYPVNGQPTTANVYIDNNLVFANINLTTQTNGQYSVTLNESTRQIIIQPNLPYLPNKNAPATYQIYVALTDVNNCQATTATNNLNLGNLSCTAQALTPQLLTPASDFVSQDPINDFSWEICTKSENIIQQTFALNGVSLWTLGATAIENNDYNLSLTNLGATACGPDTVRYTLTLKKNSYQVNGTTVGVVFNDPLDQTDWNRWAVTIKGCNNLTVASPVYRFKYLPGLLGTYYWCNNQNSCISGTLQECLLTGKNCYNNDGQTCKNNATLDCGANPPVKAYFWCTNQSQCAKGTLQECSKTGKNCYQEEHNNNGTGCVQKAVTDCSNQAQYFWCASSLTCNLGSFDECAASGKPCYRQEEGMEICPEKVRLDCQIETGILANNPFNKLPDFLPNSMDILKDLGLSPKAIQVIEALSTQVFPFLSLSLLAPLGLIVIFFPRPKGMVFDSKTKRGIAGALVAVHKEGFFVKASITNGHGFYNGFKLTPGEYQIIVSLPEYTFPSKAERTDKKNKKNFYLGESFFVQSEFSKTITFQIPMDFDQEAGQIEDYEEKSTTLIEKVRKSFYSFINYLGIVWVITFALAIIITLIYPIWLNIIILGIFGVGFIRRLSSGLHRINVTGKVLDSKGKETAGIPLVIKTLAFDHLAVEIITNKNGYFEVLLNPKNVYSITCPNFIFVETDGPKGQIVLDLKDKKTDLALVIKEKDEN